MVRIKEELRKRFVSHVIGIGHDGLDLLEDWMNERLGAPATPVAGRPEDKAPPPVGRVEPDVPTSTTVPSSGDHPQAPPEEKAKAKRF